LPAIAQPVTSLLAYDEPEPLERVNPGGLSPFVLICEHAGRLIPRALGTLGLGEEDLRRHIAWDVGTRAVALALSERLDAPLFMQRYSRLVCDCNRRPDVPAFVPELSEATRIPGNVGLSQADRRARTEAVFDPFHDSVSAFLDRREQAGTRTVLVTVHSFTPVFLGKSRPWEIGVLYNRDPVLSPAIADWLEANTAYCVGINEPYSVSDDTDYAIPVHGERRGLPCVEFEIRNDLIEDEANAGPWADRLARALEAGHLVVQRRRNEARV
jgi:predicted N-formylglutamate amidohydrolase